MSAIEDVLTRLRAEYLEMPGLCLKLDQAHRLCGVERTLCQLALDSLVNEHFLCVRPDGRYLRLTSAHNPPPTKADLAAGQHFLKAS